MNRFKMLFTAYIIVICCIMFSDHRLFNAILFFASCLAFMWAWAYVEDNMNDKEKEFLNKFKSND